MGIETSHMPTGLIVRSMINATRHAQVAAEPPSINFGFGIAAPSNIFDVENYGMLPGPFIDYAHEALFWA